MELRGLEPLTYSMRTSRLGRLFRWPRWLERNIAGQVVGDVGEHRRLSKLLRTQCGRAWRSACEALFAHGSRWSATRKPILPPVMASPRPTRYAPRSQAFWPCRGSDPVSAELVVRVKREEAELKARVSGNRFPPHDAERESRTRDWLR